MKEVNVLRPHQVTRDKDKKAMTYSNKCSHIKVSERPSSEHNGAAKLSPQ